MRLERYRSGHNEAVLKTVCPQGRMGSNPILSVFPFRFAQSQSERIFARIMKIRFADDAGSLFKARVFIRTRQRVPRATANDERIFARIMKIRFADDAGSLFKARVFIRTRQRVPRATANGVRKANIVTVIRHMEKYPSWPKGLPWKGSRSLTRREGSNPSFSVT